MYDIVCESAIPYSVWEGPGWANLKSLGSIYNTSKRVELTESWGTRFAGRPDTVSRDVLSFQERYIRGVAILCLHLSVLFIPET